MSSTRDVRIFMLYLTFLVFGGIAGCRPAAVSTPANSMDPTQAHQTVQARLTEAIARTPSGEATPSPQSTPPPTAGDVATIIPTVSATVAAPTEDLSKITSAPTASCDKAAPGEPIDVTIVDDTQMNPGEPFQKIWRLVNIGICSWNREYNAIWFSGEKFGETTRVPLAKEVLPGESVEIVVDMEAPESPGIHWSYWKLANASDLPFGIGPNGNSPFWVKIVVVESRAEQPTNTAEPSNTPTPTETATLTPTPALQVSGSATLAPNDMFDLDTNQVNTGSGHDLAYLPDPSNIHLLTPQADTLLGVYGGSQPGLANCQQAGMSSAPIAIESLSPGIYLCYRTDLGLPGWLKLDTVNDDFSIGVEIMTWALP